MVTRVTNTIGDFFGTFPMFPQIGGIPRKSSEELLGGGLGTFEGLFSCLLTNYRGQTAHCPQDRSPLPDPPSRDN